MEFGDKTIFSSLGVEFYLKEKTSLIFNSFTRTEKGNDEFNTQLDQFNSNRGLIESTKLKEYSQDDDNAHQFSSNFDKEFEDGSKISAVFQYEKNSENQSSDIENTNPNLNEKVAEYRDQKRLLVQGDYVLKINETTELELGYRGNF